MINGGNNLQWNHLEEELASIINNFDIRGLTTEVCGVL
jgi:hypothetical protein